MSSPEGRRNAVSLDHAVVILLVLGGFWLRLFRLDLQSIWSDEGLSIYRASQKLADIPGLSLAGIHPPLYDTLLHFWMPVAGSREFSTRFLSLFFGVLALAVLFQIGRSVLGRGGAVLATLVAASAPFLVYYSQETRMYAPALFFSLLSVLATLRWMRGKRSWTWLACFVAAGAAAAYTHYYAWLVIAALNLFVVIWVAACGRAGLARLACWGVAQVTLVVAYAPWARVLLDKYETYLTPGSQTSPLTLLYQTVVSFGLSYSAGQADATPGQIDVPGDHWRVVAMALALATIAGWGIVSGILTGRRRGFKLQWTFLPVYLILPVAAIIALSWGKRDFAPRYLIFAAPAYYLLIGQGLDSLLGSGRVFRRAIGGLAFLVVLGSSCVSLYNYYYDATYWRDDVRGVVDFINEQSRDGDAVLLDAFYLKPSFDFYYRGKAPVLGLPDSIPADWEQDLGILKDVADEHERLWLVLWQSYYSDPEGRIQGWLDAKGFRIKAAQFRGGFAVLGYLTRAPVSDIVLGTLVGLELGHTVKLEAHDIPPEPVCAGNEIRFALYWRALRPIATDYSVFVHLMDEDGKTWTKADSQPAGGGFPTSQWPVGPVVTDERVVTIPAGAPPGQYFLEVGMYDLGTMKRLGEGDPEAFQTNLGPIEVVPEGCRS